MCALWQWGEFLKPVHLLFYYVSIIVSPNNGRECACCDYQRGHLIWFNPTTQTSSVSAISGLCFVSSDKENDLATVNMRTLTSSLSVFTRQTVSLWWWHSCNLRYTDFVTYQWLCNTHCDVTYVQVLEQGGGTAEPCRQGSTPTSLDAKVAFCSGMMEKISIQSCI